MENKTNPKNAAFVCTSCKKEMVAGPYPQWFCLHKECVQYLKPKNL
jgi:hypothetical protein